MGESTRRILLAEDDRFLRKAAETALKRQGFTVLAAVDGEEALRMARTEAQYGRGQSRCCPSSSRVSDTKSM